MQMLASLFFFLVLALAAGVVGAMVWDYRERIVAALAGQGAVPLVGVTFHNLSPTSARNRRTSARRFSPVRLESLPLAA